MARFKGSVSDFFLGEEADVHRLVNNGVLPLTGLNSSFIFSKSISVWLV